VRLAAAFVGIGLTLAGGARAKAPPERSSAHGVPVSAATGHASTRVPATAPSVGRSFVRPGPVRPPPWTRPAPPLPMLPSVGRVRVEVGRDRLLIVEDVHLPRGDWESGDLDLYVAFGAPGAPIAIDARLIAATPAVVEPRPEDTGERIGADLSAERGPGAQPLLGPPQMAGIVVHVKEAQLRRAYGASDLAILRIRSLLRTPATDASGGQDVVVRLGAPGGTPMTLGRIQVVSLEPHPWISRAEANLCGPDADVWPLSVTVSPRPVERSVASRADTIAPPMAVRHDRDDLCIRWWTGKPVTDPTRASRGPAPDHARTSSP
jgi:hypothetical protein